MEQHTDILIGITNILFLIVIGFITWQGKRQIGRIDKLEERLVCTEESTNKVVTDIRNNYVNQFRDVRKDISDLKESNAVHFGDLKCSIGKIETTIQMKARHIKEDKE